MSGRLMSVRLVVKWVIMNAFSVCKMDEKDFWSLLDALVNRMMRKVEVIVEADFNGHTCWYGE